MSRGALAWRAALLVGALGLGGLPSSTALAMDQRPDVVAAPLGDTATVELPGRAFSGAVADVSGDGAREIVRLVSRSVGQVVLAVEAWTEQDGSWRRHDAQPVARRSGLPQAPHAGGQLPDPDGLVPMLLGEPARLLTWNDGQRERLLLAATGSSGVDHCCLAIHEVSVVGGELQLTPLETESGPATEVHAMDMSADGVDELLVLAPVSDEEGRATLLRWTGNGFVIGDEIAIPVERSGGVVLESDGRPGLELLLSARGPAPVAGGRAWSLLRLALADGALVTEQARAPIAAGQGLIAPWPAEPGLLVTDFDGTTTRVRWPSGERPVSTGRAPVRGYPLAVLGDGSTSRVLLLEGSFLSGRRGGALLRVLDEDLEPLQRVRPSDAARGFRTAGEPVAAGDDGPRPYVGDLPGGLPDGRFAFIFDGRLITESGIDGCERDCLSIEPAATLPGMAPIGVAGGQGGWLAVARTERGFSDTRRSGGRLPTRPQQAESWSLIPTEALLAPGPEGLELEHRGAASHPALPGVVLSPPGGFETDLAAPPGSRVYLVSAGIVGESRVVGSGGRIRVEMPPAGASEDSEPERVRLLIVTPAGAGVSVELEIAVLHDPPLLEIEAQAPPFSFSVPLSGRTSDSATLTIDGREVVIERGGSFETEVRAGPWPRTVTAVAADPFGRTTRESLTVIGFIDYRELPWPAIVLGLTIAVALAVYLFAPRAGRRTAEARSQASGLEELSDE